MNNEIEEITDLFDEFFIIDSPDEVSLKDRAETNVSALPVAEKEIPQPPVPEPVISGTPVTGNPVQTEINSLPPLNFSGANKKHIAVIYNDKNNDNRENVEMLSNLITKALKFSMDDVAIIRLSRNPDYSLPAILEELKPEYLMAWGAFDLLKAENKDATIHQVTEIGKTRLLVADEVHTYHNNATYKTALWQAIQLLFTK